MAGKVTLIYWVLGDEHSFTVEISPDNLIGQLQRAIADDFKVNIRQLELYISNIQDTTEERQNFKFEDHKVLRGSIKISTGFNSGFLEGCIHVAIKCSGM